MGDKSRAVKGFLTEHILNIVSDSGKEALTEIIKNTIKDGSLEIASTIGLDMLASMLPAVGGAISTYRTEQKIRNIRIALEKLSEKSDLIEQNLLEKDEESKIKIDKIFELLFDKVSSTSQEEKIEYMVSGFVHVTKAENVNFDIAYLYYDTLERLTLLDIATLKLSYQTGYYSDTDVKTYNDILEEFNIEYSQYVAIRENLLRMGLLENQYDDASEKDLKNSIDAINDLHKIIKSMQDTLTNPKKKMRKVKGNLNLKPKAKDRLKISKFGRDFIKYFINV